MFYSINSRLLVSFFINTFLSMSFLGYGAGGAGVLPGGGMLSNPILTTCITANDTYIYLH